MTLTLQQLGAIANNAGAQTIARYLDTINATMEKYEINTPLRACHFLAQLIHESGSFRYTTELADGKAYENRKDLGNTKPGDGPLFKGRGFIQLTGRANYAAYGQAIGKDLINQPGLVAVDYAADVAGWFWHGHSINALADMDNINAVTRMINGGYNGLADRQYYLDRAKKVLLDQGV